MTISTIQVKEETKKRLQSMKLHPRESYNELISRLINSSSPENVSRETLIETLEILSDSEFLKGIERGIQDIEAGKIRPLSKVMKELQ